MFKRSLRARSRAGFTLIELMLVVVIIGVLAAMIVPSLAGRTEKSRVTRAQADIKAGLATALNLFEQETGAYPTTAQGLDALVKEPDGVTGWHGPYLPEGSMPLDPWGREYHYTSPGVHNTATYDLVSYGRDGKEGGGDDVANYTDEKK